jgi:hypothetical protein
MDTILLEFEAGRTVMCFEGCIPSVCSVSRADRFSKNRHVYSESGHTTHESRTEGFEARFIGLPKNFAGTIWVRQSQIWRT